MTGRVRAGIVVGLVALLAAFMAGRITGDDGDGASPADPPVTGAPSAADVAFARGMSLHHDQAVLMANMALNHAGPAVRGIAAAILGNQAMEAGTMRGWLRVWGEPVTPTTPTATPDEHSGHDMSGMGHGSMPGMASADELDRLYALHGKRFDVLFLQLMIRHHEGGLMMTQAAIDGETLEFVRQTAQQMGAEQLEELATMKALLQADGGEPLPSPQG